MSDRVPHGTGVALLTAGVLPLYAGIRFGSEALGAPAAAIMLLAALGYLLAMMVYRVLARLTFDGRLWIVAVASAASLAIAVVLSRQSSVWMIAVELAVPVLSSVAVGLAAQRAVRFRSAYVLGLIVLIGCLLVRYWSEWPSMIRDLTYMTDEALAHDGAGALDAAGLASVPFGRGYLRMMHRVVPLVPGLLTMSAVVQFSVGTVWFFYGVARRSVSTAVTLSFTRWKMPRPVVLVLLAAALVHLVGSAGPRLIADNVLLGLLIFYSVTGFAALEYVFQARRAPIWIRIVVYIVIALTHLYGLAAIALVGVIDSLFGWRVDAR